MSTNGRINSHDVRNLNDIYWDQVGSTRATRLSPLVGNDVFHVMSMVL